MRQALGSQELRTSSQCGPVFLAKCCGFVEHYTRILNPFQWLMYTKLSPKATKFDSQYLHTTGHSEGNSSATQSCNLSSSHRTNTWRMPHYIVFVIREFLLYSLPEFFVSVATTRSTIFISLRSGQFQSPKLCECPEIQRHSVFCNKVYR